MAFSSHFSARVVDVVSTNIKCHLQESIFKSQIRPVRKKLTKCRDPDRWNLSELQRQRREQGLGREDSEERAAASNGNKDAAIFGGDLSAGAPEKKRRKVGGNGLEDPFGGPL